MENDIKSERNEKYTLKKIFFKKKYFLVPYLQTGETIITCMVNGASVVCQKKFHFFYGIQNVCFWVVWSIYNVVLVNLGLV